MIYLLPLKLTSCVLNADNRNRNSIIYGKGTGFTTRDTRFKTGLKMRIIMPIKWACWEGGAQMYRKCFSKCQVHVIGPQEILAPFSASLPLVYSQKDF